MNVRHELARKYGKVYIAHGVLIHVMPTNRRCHDQRKKRGGKQQHEVKSKSKTKAKAIDQIDIENYQSNVGTRKE